MIPPYGHQHRLLAEAPVDHAFAFGPAARLLAVIGVRPATARIVVDAGQLDVRFGPWRVRTPLANVAGAAHSGPFALRWALGARLSLADRGLTFGTDRAGGVCITFREPVPGIEPLGIVRHPSLTVTVAEPELLVARLTRPEPTRARRADPNWRTHP